jgi:pimeloyl-ACP methyl ester carboxylesterase
MQLGRAHHLDADGVRVYAVEWVPEHGSSGQHVLLVHGLGANTLSWTPFAQAFADATGATVTAIDLVGFGRTRAPERTASIATNRTLIEAVLRERGPALVIGNSMGAVIGTGVCARHPDLVDALVLVNPALPWGRIGPTDLVRLARLTPLMMPSVGRHAISTRARLLGPERVVDSTLAVTLHEPGRLDPELRRRLVLLASERYAYPEAAAAYADAARSLLRELGRGGFDRDLAAASAARPTLLVHGAEDRLVGSGLARAAGERHLDVTVEVLDGVGHAPQLEAPERLLEVTARWLDAAAGLNGGLDARMGPWRSERAGVTPARAVGSSGSRSGPSSAT